MNVYYHSFIYLWSSVYVHDVDLHGQHSYHSDVSGKFSKTLEASQLILIHLFIEKAKQLSITKN